MANKWGFLGSNLPECASHDYISIFRIFPCPSLLLQTVKTNDLNPVLQKNVGFLFRGKKESRFAHLLFSPELFHFCHPHYSTSTRTAESLEIVR
jgi:hypothetical protein